MSNINFTQKHSVLIPLDGVWFICIDPDNTGREKKWYARFPSEACPASVPGVIQDSFPEYHGLAWYQKEFTPPENLHHNGKYLLWFYDIDYTAEIWLNGKKIGTHEGLEEIFVIDAGDAIKPCQQNRLVIRVLSPANEPIDGMTLNELAVGRRRYPEPVDHAYATGGIIGSVELLLTPEIYVNDVFTIPDWRTGTIDIRVSITNAGLNPSKVSLIISVAPATGGGLSAAAMEEYEIPPAVSTVTGTMQIPDHRLWELNDPYLYCVTVRVSAAGCESFDEHSVRCGFRDFRFEDGYFRLNGKRIRLNGALYTILNFPAAQSIPYDEDLLRRDVLNMKALGFNFIRIHCGSTLPRQLDVFDEMGLLVLEESFGAGWAKDSDHIATDWERSISRVIRRDRNHPSIVIWSLLNEIKECRLFRHAVKSIPIIRDYDQTRMLLLNSGRFDLDETIGNVCNPYEKLWGSDLRDVHVYPVFPHTHESMREMRSTISNFASISSIYNQSDERVDQCPILLSEYGVCGAEDLPHIVKEFERIGKADAGDSQLYRRKYEMFLQEWKKMRLDQCWARPEDYFQESHRNLAALIRDDFNTWSANPMIVGSFSSTQIVDAWFHGCGITTCFRKLKPGMADTYTDIFAPLRFSLFVEPGNIYRGAAVKLEAVLTNQDVLKPGKYPLCFQVIDPELNCILNERLTIDIPDATATAEKPFSNVVFSKETVIDGPCGTYRFIADFEQGAQASGGDTVFYVADASLMPVVPEKIILWGEDEELAGWLTQNGIQWQRMADADPQKRYGILVSGKPPAIGGVQAFDELAGRIAEGSAAIFLTPETLLEENSHMEKNPRLLHWAPFGNDQRPSLDITQTWYFRCDHWAKKHPIFEGLPAGGIMDYRFYRNIISGYVVAGLHEPFEAVCGAMQASGADSARLRSDALLTIHNLNTGEFILNTLRIRENIGKDPVAEHLLRNLLCYAVKAKGK